jgi:bifunctional enzyme CysN/CysC
MSALNGDNVVERSKNMPWYQGSSLLHHLENVHIASDRNLVDARFPVQWVVRPQSQSQEHHDYRGYAGQVAGGVMKAGDDRRRPAERLHLEDRAHRDLRRRRRPRPSRR